MHGSAAGLDLFQDSKVCPASACDAHGQPQPIANFLVKGQAFGPSTYCKSCKNKMSRGDWVRHIKGALTASQIQSTEDVWKIISEVARDRLAKHLSPTEQVISRVARVTEGAIRAEIEALLATHPAAESAPEKPAENPARAKIHSAFKRYLAACVKAGEVPEAPSTRFWASIKKHAGVARGVAFGSIEDADTLDRMLVKAQSLVFEAEG